MKIDPMMLIAFFSLLGCIYFGIKSASRDDRQDTEGKATEMAKISVKLDNVLDGVSDIRKDLNDMKKDMQDDHDKLIGVDKSVKVLWRQFDEYRGIIRTFPEDEDKEEK